MKATGRLLWCWVAMGLAAADAETLTIATYNVENYVATNRLVDGIYRENYPKPETAKTALRAAIRALDADVLALQEIGPAPYLEELRRDLRNEGVDYPHAVLLQAADPERHVAVLSRRPLAAIGRHADLEFEYFGARERVKRGLLEVRVAMEAGEVTLFVIHLKSRFTDRADDPTSGVRRAAEAVAVRNRVLEIFPNPATARFVIAGDCNDSPNSRPLDALARRGKTKIATIVPAADSRGDSWTHFYRKEDIYSRVDYFLISPGFMTAAAEVHAQIFDEANAKLASDHRPLWLRVSLPPSGGSPPANHR
jgi:endonuclease/exonuclease/phosphatase family metal-dependent hydrolase